MARIRKCNQDSMFGHTSTRYIICTKDNQLWIWRRLSTEECGWVSLRDKTHAWRYNQHYIGRSYKEYREGTPITRLGLLVETGRGVPDWEDDPIK